MTAVTRKLTTILAADAAEYSRAMERDEVATYGALHAARAVFARLIARHSGRIANTAGDGLIAEFPSVVEAVTCAVEVQTELSQTRADRPLAFRIGIHLGDVIVDGDDLIGEGVNLAARLQSMAEPGGILISRPVYDQVRSKLTLGFESLGDRRPRNFDEDVTVYRVATSATDAAAASRRARKARRAPPRDDRPPRDGLAEPAYRSRVAPASPIWPEALVRKATVLGLAWLLLLLIDLVSGGGFFVQWVIPPMLVWLGWQVAPILAEPPLQRRHIRAAALLIGLLLINVFSWSGEFWVIWPAIGLVVAEAAHVLLVRRRA